MGNNLFLRKMLLLAGMLFTLNNGPLFAETAPKDEGAGRFFGEVKEVNCAAGEVKVTGIKGDKKGTGEVFILGKDAELKGVKDCQGLSPNGRVLIRYIDRDGKKTITYLNFKPHRGTASPPVKTRAKSLMGWVDSVDCAKGSLVIGRMEDRTKTESFALVKDTTIDAGTGGGSCEGLKKGQVVSLLFDEKDGKKIVSKVNVAAREGR